MNAATPPTGDLSAFAESRHPLEESKSIINIVPSRFAQNDRSGLNLRGENSDEDRIIITEQSNLI